MKPSMVGSAHFQLHTSNFKLLAAHPFACEEQGHHSFHLPRNIFGSLWLRQRTVPSIVVDASAFQARGRDFRGQDSGFSMRDSGKRYPRIVGITLGVMKPLTSNFTTSNFRQSSSPHCPIQVASSVFSVRRRSVDVAAICIAANSYVQPGACEICLTQKAQKRQIDLTALRRDLAAPAAKRTRFTSHFQLHTSNLKLRKHRRGSPHAGNPRARRPSTESARLAQVHRELWSVGLLGRRFADGHVHISSRPPVIQARPDNQMSHRKKLVTASRREYRRAAHK